MKGSIYAIVILRNKSTGEIFLNDHTVSGENATDRLHGIIQCEANSWNREWDLISVSHAYIPPDP